MIRHNLLNKLVVCKVSYSVLPAVVVLFCSKIQLSKTTELDGTEFPEF